MSSEPKSLRFLKIGTECHEEFHEFSPRHRVRDGHCPGLNLHVPEEVPYESIARVVYSPPMSSIRYTFSDTSRAKYSSSKNISKFERIVIDDKVVGTSC